MTKGYKKTQIKQDASADNVSLTIDRFIDELWILIEKFSDKQTSDIIDNICKSLKERAQKCKEDYNQCNDFKNYKA